MDFKQFKNQIVGAQTENRWLRLAAVGLLISNTLLAAGMLSTNTVVTIQPPHLDEAVRITENRASATYKKGWGLFIANLMGNVKPGTSDFIIDTLTPLLAPDLYRRIKDAIQTQALKLNRAEAATAFTARQISYDPRTNLVYVTGLQTTTGPSSDPVKLQRTYEIRIAINDYRPRITRLRVYPGEPHIEEDS